MNSLFATTFPDLESAQRARDVVEKYDADGTIRLVSSVVISKDANGFIEHEGRTAAGTGALIGGVVGGILGMAGGPAVAAIGAASGAVGGGWFDINRAEDRNFCMERVRARLDENQAALLGEVINPSDEARREVEAQLVELGGDVVGK